MNTQMQYMRRLPTPEELKDEIPVSKKMREIKLERDKMIADIFAGKDDHFLLIIGPCSADREDAVLDYTMRLRKVQDKVSDKIMIIPRVYTNKPRSKGVGYKGMFHQPDPEGPENIFEGVKAVRHMHVKVMQETGFSCAEELLYPENHRYVSDLLSYVAVGARSVEDQQHRLVVSGLDIPAGMKNPTGGDVSVMMNAITAAQSEQDFLYRGWEVRTQGNPLAHAILRGYVDNLGDSKPNYHYEDLMALIAEYQKHPNLENPAVIIDTNHANSGKNCLEQPRIARDVMHSRSLSKDIHSFVKGLMIESYIEDGKQKIGEGVYGKSITDPCLGWEKTERLIYELAELV